LLILYPNDWQIAAYDRLLGSKPVLDALKAGKTTNEIESCYAEQLAEFQKRREPWLLYRSSSTRPRRP
jgi:hypothetical protein